MQGYQLTSDIIPPINVTAEELKYFSNIEIFKGSGIEYRPSISLIYDLSGLNKIKEIYIEEGYKAYLLDINFPDLMPNLKVLHYSLGASLDFSRMPNIEDLAVMNPTIENVSSLKKLKVGGPNISLKNLPNLTELEFGMTTGNDGREPHHQGIEDQKNIYLENLPKISNLIIRGVCSTHPMGDISIKNLSNLKSIEEFKFINSTSPGVSVASISLENLPNLTDLNLNNVLVSEINTQDLLALEYLNCGENWELKSLDLSKNIQLKNLTLYGVGHNWESVLDLSNNINLIKLHMDLVPVKELDLRSPNLSTFFCRSCVIDKLIMKNGFYDIWLDNTGSMYPPQEICADEVELDKLRSLDFGRFSYTPIITSDCGVNNGNIAFAFDPFKEYLLSSSPTNDIAKDFEGNAIAIDANGDGEISYEEALKVVSLYVNAGDVIANYSGNSNDFSTEELKYFSNIETFSCYGQYGSTLNKYLLDLSGLNKLKSFLIDNEYKNYGLDFKFPKNLPNLITAHYSKFLSYVEVSQMPNIEELYVSNPTIEDVSSLKRIKVLEGDIKLKNLPNLTDLTLSISNNYTLNIISLENLPGIKKILIRDKEDKTPFYYKIQDISINDLVNLEQIDLNNRATSASYASADIGSITLKKLPKLKNLDLGGVSVSELNTSELPVLEYLNCNYNTKLKSLDLSKNIQLKELLIGSSEYVSSLDLSKNTQLKNLTLYSIPNQWEILDLTHNKNLTEFSVMLMSIKKLDLSNSKLSKFIWGTSEVDTLIIKNGIYDTWLDNTAFMSIGTALYICADKEEIEILKGINFGDSTPIIAFDCEPYFKEENLENPTEIIPDPDKENLLSVPTSISIYPNPVKNTLFINTQQKVNRVEIYDINGSLLSKQSVKDNKVDTSFLSKGYYIMIIHTDLGKDKYKFIKQ